MTEVKKFTNTSSGKTIQLSALNDNVYDVADIAAALAKQCRYNGHCRYFYSVAQHSVLASRMAPQPHKLAALLHDASEAYLGDIVTPVKKSFPDLVAFEDQMHAAIFKSFGLAFPMDPIVHEVDRRMLRTEMALLMPQADPVAWGYGDVEPYENVLTTPYSIWTWEQAEYQFITTYDQLSFKDRRAA